MIDVNNDNITTEFGYRDWLDGYDENKNSDWLGNGTTSDKIVEILKREL